MIAVRLAEVMEARNVGVNELAARIGITNVNLSRIKTGKTRSMRFSTLSALCRALDCQPGNLLEYVPGGPDLDEA